MQAQSAVREGFLAGLAGAEAFARAIGGFREERWELPLMAKLATATVPRVVPRLHILTCATNLDHAGLRNLRLTVEANGFDLHVQPVMPGRWCPAKKLRAQREWIDRGGASSDDLLLYIDGYDTLLLPTTVAELLSAFVSFHAPIVVSGCRYQWPKVTPEEVVRLYDGVPQKIPYRYLCAGSFMGIVQYISEMIDKIPWSRDGRLDYNLDDQLAMQQYRVRFPNRLVIDHDCRLFVSVGRHYDNLRLLKYHGLARVLVFDDDHWPDPEAGCAAPPVLHLENDDAPKWDYNAIVELVRREKCVVGQRLVPIESCDSTGAGRLARGD